MALEKTATGYVMVAAGILAVTTVLKLSSAHINATTVALALFARRAVRRHLVGRTASRCRLTARRFFFNFG